VPFLPDGHCAAIPDGDGRLQRSSGEVRPGEHWLLDTALRIPLETAGFRFRWAHPFAYDAEEAHLYAWLDGGIGLAVSGRAGATAWVDA
jgi:hypothetical protein